MRKFIMVALLSLCIVGIAHAAVVLYDEGTQKGVVDKINVVGGDVVTTVAGKTGTVTVSGDLTTTNLIAAGINWQSLFEVSPTINWAAVTGL